MERERARENDPNRCQSIYDQGQCPYKAIPPGNYCMTHGGTGIVATEKKERVNNYRLTKYRARVNEFAEAPEIKSLREEIGIVRMIIEETLNKCNDSSDLLIYSTKISGLIQQVEKLVVACHRLEERTGVLIDKPTVIVLCDSLVKIISTYIEDPDALDKIASDFLDNVARMGGMTNVLNDVRINAAAN